MRDKKILFFISFLILTFGKNSHAGSLSERDRIKIVQALEGAKTQVLARQMNGRYWNMPLYLGSMYVSQYVLIRHWLEISIKDSQFKLKLLPPSDFDVARFRKLLIETQLQDGSWELVHDANRVQGDLNTTLWNYAALKVLGEQISSPWMSRARQWILSRGGIEQSSLFSKIILSLFSNYSWEKIPNIPYILFNENMPMNYQSFGQWIPPHLIPISYLKHVQMQKHLGPLFDLSELNSESGSHSFWMKSRQPGEGERLLIVKMLESQKPQGSWGAYTLSTLLTLIAFDHYQSHFSDLDSQIDLARNRGLLFIEKMYVGSDESAYLGTACDGHYWDTMLIGQGLLEAGVSSESLSPVLRYLLNIQDATGGFGFGIDFEIDYPDTDDTAEVLLYVSKHLKGKIDQFPSVRGRVERALQWLLKMQNSDGGWGAFNRNNTGNFFLSFMTRNFNDSADLFDESSVDVTGHILEALGTFGYTIKNSDSIKKAVDYLKSQQSKFGPWEARWGTNYIYGTGAVLVGLSYAGVPSKDPVVQKAASWLLKCKSSEGGYGESFYSYTDPAYACHGVNTPSQTAWALMGLIASGNANTSIAREAALYLAETYLKMGTWKDDSVVGTGHPRIVPMQYPSYAWAFPMMALSRYLSEVTR